MAMRASLHDDKQAAGMTVHALSYLKNYDRASWTILFQLISNVRRKIEAPAYLVRMVSGIPMVWITMRSELWTKTYLKKSIYRDTWHSVFVENDVADCALIRETHRAVVQITVEELLRKDIIIIGCGVFRYIQENDNNKVINLSPLEVLKWNFTNSYLQMTLTESSSQWQRKNLNKSGMINKQLYSFLNWQWNK